MGNNITKKSSFDIWKDLNPEGAKEDFLKYLSEKELLLSKITANDINGITGNSNETVNAQTLLDIVTQKIINLENIDKSTDTN